MLRAGHEGQDEGQEEGKRKRTKRGRRHPHPRLQGALSVATFLKRGATVTSKYCCLCCLFSVTFSCLPSFLLVNAAVSGYRLCMRLFCVTFVTTVGRKAVSTTLVVVNWKTSIGRHRDFPHF